MSCYTTLTRLIQGLIDSRGLSLDRLVHDKYRLRDAIAARLAELRAERRRAGFQSLLLPSSPSAVVVDPRVMFRFSPTDYPCSERYNGAYVFRKHYYKEVGDLRSEGEEFECAQYIDSLPAVKFWVRNLERRPDHAFWFQTSSDKFYPDFVCLLHDGRYLVVEYKGEDRWSNDDSKEKRNIGELWEERSAGRCLFVMPKGRRFDAVELKARPATTPP